LNNGASLSVHRFAVPTTAPYNFELALDYLRTSPSTVAEVITNESYGRAVRLNGKPMLLTVSKSAAREARGCPALDVALAGPDVDERDTVAAMALVRRIFATEIDLAPLMEQSTGDPVFADLVRDYAGLRPVLIPDVFEAIVWAIIGQQINVQFAAKCKRALVERYGERLHLDGRDYLLFPEPEQLAEAREADLAALQFSRQKIRYILNLARQVAAGDLRLDELWALPMEEAQTRLEGILGIGRWTAEYVLMRGLGHPDVIPAADGGLRRIIGQLYGLGRLASEAEVRALAENWVGWRSYAAFYLWFTLQEQERQRRAHKERTAR